MSEMNKCTACSYIISGICADCERKNLIITLERQIEEAREFLKEAYELLEYGIEDNEDVIWCDKYNEKLKEKGE